MPGFDWFAGMDAVNIEELGWALEGEDVLAREIERVAASMLERVVDDRRTARPRRANCGSRPARLSLSSSGAGTTSSTCSRSAARSSPP
jgi:hypothetical protein